MFSLSSKKLITILMVISTLVSACARASGPTGSTSPLASSLATAPDNQSTTSTNTSACEEGGVVFADEQLELLYQAALSDNPQWNGCDQQKRAYFFFRYGGDAAKQVYAKAYAEEEGNIAFVQAGSVLTLSNPPGWLFAMATLVGTSTIIAMNAQQAANLSLPTIPFEQIGDDLQMMVMVASVTTTIITLEAQANTAADAYLQSVTTQFEGTQALEATLKNGKIFDERFGPITWVVSDGLMKCLVDLQVWHVNSGQTLHINNENKPKSSGCTPEYIQSLISELIRKGIEAGIELKLMNEVGELIFKSISSKFGW